jgi:hypothetical protein
VRIAQERINQTVAAKLPLQRAVGPVAWRIDAADLAVLDQGRIGVDAAVHGAVDGREADAHIVGAGTLSAAAVLVVRDEEAAMA